MIPSYYNPSTQEERGYCLTARLVATMMAIQAGYNGFDSSIVEKRFSEYFSAIQQLNLELIADLLGNALLEWLRTFGSIIENRPGIPYPLDTRKGDNLPKKHLIHDNFSPELGMAFHKRSLHYQWS